jgi:hypothetical protein
MPGQVPFEGGLPVLRAIMVLPADELASRDCRLRDGVYQRRWEGLVERASRQ